MRQFWIFLITALITVTIVLLFLWITSNTMKNETIMVEEWYRIEPSDKFRVLQLTSLNKNDTLTVSGDIECREGNCLYLKKNIPYTVKVLKSSDAVIWSSGK